MVPIHFAANTDFVYDLVSGVILQGIFPCSYVQVRPTSDQERYAAVTKSTVTLYGFSLFNLEFISVYKFDWLHGITCFFLGVGEFFCCCCLFLPNSYLMIFLRSGVGITTIQ